MQCGGVLLLDAACDVPLCSVFRECVLHCYSYKDFLTCQGETAIRCSEWASAPDGAANVPGDCSGLAFAFQRSLDYQHLRTFLPGLGLLGLLGLPTRVPASTKQYLHVVGRRAPRARRTSRGGGGKDGAKDGAAPPDATAELAACLPQRCVLLSVTTFGAHRLLPLLDSVAVFCYWVFESNPQAQGLRLRCACRVEPLSGLRALRDASLGRIAGLSFTQHVADGLLDRARLAAYNWLPYAVDRSREHIAEEAAIAATATAKDKDKSKEKERGQGEALSVRAGDESAQWSEREQQRVQRLGRRLVARDLADVLREQRADGPGGFRKGRNSLSALYHTALLVAAVVVLLLASASQSRANSALSTRLMSMAREAGELQRLLEVRAERQKELLGRLSTPVPPPTLSLGGLLPTAMLSSYVGFAPVAGPARTEL